MNYSDRGGIWGTPRQPLSLPLPCPRRKRPKRFLRPIAQLEDQLAAARNNEPAAADPAKPPHREQGQRSKPDSPEGDPLEAARARAEARGRAKQVARQQSKDRTDAIIMARGRRATSPLAVLAAPEWWYVVGAIAAAVLLTGAATAFRGANRSSSRLHRADPDYSLLEYGSPLVGVAALVLVLAGWSARKSFERELAWMQELPFAVIGHVRFLGSGYDRFTLKFAHDEPPKDLARAIAGGVALPSCTVEHKNDRPLMYSVSVRGATSVRDHWVAWRAVVRDLLLPLHSKYPIVEVSFDKS